MNYADSVLGNSSVDNPIISGGYMSHWEYYGDNQHKLDLKVILEDILKSTTDPKVSKRFEIILEEIERLEKKIKDLESDIEIRYESLHTSIEETLGEL